MFKWIKNFSKRGCTAYITHPSFLLHDMGYNHPENAKRLIAIREKLLEDNLFDNLNEVEADKINQIQLSRVHSPKYEFYLESVAPFDEKIFKINEETIMNKHTLEAMKFSAGAVIKAVDMVMKHKAPNVFCAVRPPGHHAEAKKSLGFCFFNNVALGAMHAIAQYNLKRVLIVDFDIHHGNGTEDIFKDNKNVMFISLFEKDLFPLCNEKKQLGSNKNIFKTPLFPGEGGKEFRDLVNKIWLPNIKSFAPQIIFLSSGFDAHVNDNMSNVNLVEDDFVWLTNNLLKQAKKFCGGKLISVLEGGYHIPSLANCVALHIKSLIDFQYKNKVI